MDSDRVQAWIQDGFKGGFKIVLAFGFKIGCEIGFNVGLKIAFKTGF